MNFAHNWARVFVVITLLTFGKLKSLVESFQILSLSVCSSERMNTLLQLEEWLRCLAGEIRNNRYRNFGWIKKKIAGVYGVRPATAKRWSID